MGLVAGLNDLASGDGHWRIGLPPGNTIAVDDPGIENQIALVQLTIDLRANQPNTMTFTGPKPTGTPDSIGYTTFVQYNVVNNTGHDLNSVVFDLQNATPRALSLVPGVIEFGETVNANYPYFTDIQQVAGHPISLFSPDGKPTTSVGPAASRLVLNGAVPAGGGMNGSFILHNTELASGSNDFTWATMPS